MDKWKSDYIGRTSVSIAAGLVRIAASLAFIWVSKRLVDIATGAVEGNLTEAALFLGFLIIAKVFTGSFESWWTKRNTVKTQIILQNLTFSKLMTSRWDSGHFRSGDVGSRLQEDIRVIVEMLCTRVPAIVVTVSQLAAVSIFMISMSVELLLILFGVMMLFVVCGKLFYRILRRLTAEIREGEAQALQLMQESFLNKLLVMTLFGVENVTGKLSAVQNKIKSATLRRADYSALARVFVAMGFIGGYGIAFLWGVYGLKAGTVTYGMMTAILQLVNQIQRPVVDMAYHVPAFIRTLTSVDRLKDLWNQPQEETGEPVVLSEPPAIVLKNVSFSYSEPVLNDFTFRMPAGSLTVVTGVTGRGKTTLLHLILAVLRPSAGTITLECTGGQKVEVSPATRSNFMYVPQGNSLVSGTIRDNMLLANPEASDEDIRQVLHSSAADFVFELSEGLDTMCGEKGCGLSEGQCQRIAVARALLHKGVVMILDEATSALDPQTEEVLLQRLVNNCHGRKTIIFVSHRERVSSIADCLLEL